jgi:hypothetical protein
MNLFFRFAILLCVAGAGAWAASWRSSAEFMLFVDFFPSTFDAFFLTNR